MATQPHVKADTVWHLSSYTKICSSEC